MPTPTVHRRVLVHGVRLNHRLRGPGSHARVAAALHETALEALRPSRLTKAERDWLRDALSEPVRCATEAALGTLTAELERVFTERDVPSGIAEAVAAAPGSRPRSAQSTETSDA